MPHLLYKDRRLERHPHETVLDCLLRHGVAVSYACRAGMCQACIVRAVDCTATEDSSTWVKPELQAKGYTLGCRWVPEGDAGVALPDLADFAHKATITALTKLNDTVLQVLLEPLDARRMFSYRPGQYLNATNPLGVSRAYSIANDYAVDGFIELHISATTHGEFTHWLFAQARIGDALYLSGPMGDCFYDAVEDADAPLLLAGLGTGLAPLLGIARAALRQGHQQAIHLYHGGRSAAQLYLCQQLQSLTQQHANFHYHACTLEAARGLATGRLEEVVAQDFAKANTRSYRHYLCGSPAFVHSLRKKLYLLGARSEHIHCDPFTERTVVPD